ncbi:MAG: tRNA pseudouridine(55) synthase TruB [Ignavibacteria bacterium]
MEISDIQEKYDNKVILVDKPLYWTSAKVTNKIKKTFKLKKVGHSGTLDPKATGLLVICTGKKTKTITEMIGADKDYEGTIRIGAVTPTYDTESDEQDIMDASNITEEQIIDVRNKFRGEIEQIPPMHSAIKHKGKPIYKLARKGKTLELMPRRVFIKEFQIERISETEIKFFVSVSKGTYIRSLANDFGAELGIGGYLKTLRRLRVGDFDIRMIDEKSEELDEMRFLVIEESL